MSEHHRLEREFTFEPYVALHARSAAQVVQTVASFDAVVEVIYRGREADARSILALLALGAPKGATIRVRAEGREAERAMAAVAALIAGRFGE